MRGMIEFTLIGFLFAILKLFILSLIAYLFVQ